LKTQHPSQIIMVVLSRLATNMLVARTALPPSFTYQLLGNSTSSFSNVYRDGGGGGQVGGTNFIVFADGIETTGGYPRNDNSNMRGFQSNSIAAVQLSLNSNTAPSLQDYGSNGIPNNFVPFMGNETPSKTGIWPNSNIATIQNGQAGVAFYPVVDRSTGPNFKQIYGTGVKITVGSHGPVATRPKQSLFLPDEVNYGLFSSLPGTDGYLYMFGTVTNTIANGLKMARVPQSSVFDRTTYQYWNGAAWTKTVTPYNDGGKANIFNYTQSDLVGNKYGPSSGDLFYSRYYGMYMLIFQSIGIDPTVYMSYSSKMDSGWSKPVTLFTMPTLGTGFNYNVHAYPAFSSNQKTIPISFTQYCTCEVLHRIPFFFCFLLTHGRSQSCRSRVLHLLGKHCFFMSC
jgi:hypothetical protein